jgi:hypothetical protein
LKRKQGIYCLEQPLFRKDGKRLFKIGYARDNLYKRIRDYKTAYGVIPFIIHVLWAVPEKVLYKRANFTLLTEGIIHKSLHAECAMKDENYKQNGEWFYDIKKIVATIKNIEAEYKDDPLMKTEGWSIYYNPEYDNVLARKSTRTMKSESDIKSSLSGINVIDRTPYKRAATQRNYKT